MNDRIAEPILIHTNPDTATPAEAPRRDRAARLARGTEQGLPAAEVSAEDALDEALRRGIALLCLEQLEHSFFTAE